MASLPLLEHELIVVTGKGGVGKTVVAAALASMAAAKGRETLLIEMVNHPKAATLFGVDPQGYEPVEVQEHLHLSRLTPAECLEEIAVMRLKLRALYKLVFQNKAVSAVMGFMPGMNELLVLGKVVYMVNKGLHRAGRHAFDLVIVDGPPTGEGLAMLQFPRTIRQAVKAGPLVRDVGIMEDLLTDPGRTAMAVITAPEELPVNEALELTAGLDELDMLQGGTLFVNRVTPSFFDPRTRDALQRFRRAVRTTGRKQDPGVLAQLSVHRHLIERRDREQAEIQRLRRGAPVPIVELPEIPSTKFGPVELAHLVRHLTRGLEMTRATRVEGSA
ncbi:MAG: ArsA-related P-loop ATPase [Pseudomonadota bacterium]